MSIAEVIGSNLLLFHIGIILSSLIIVSKSSDLLVYSISNYSKKLGVSDYLVGFLVVGIGTALPELIASITGATLGQGGIVFGTMIGSNMFKIPLLGIVIFIGKKIKTEQKAVGNAPIITFLMALLPLLLVLDNNISRADGIILFVAFLVYIGRLWHGEGQFGTMKKDVKLKNIYKDGIIFIGSLVALLLSARWLVFSSIKVSEMINISPYLIGLIVIGVGGSSPELMVQVRSVMKQHQGLALGNVMGSIVANSTLVLGITAIIKPFNMAMSELTIAAIFTFIGVLITLIILRKDELNTKDGFLLIGIYAVFIIAEIFF